MKRLRGLAGSSDALALARLAQTKSDNSGRAFLAVVCENAVDAQRLSEEIAWFDPSLRIHLLPDWETLPYDAFSPHQDLVSERLAALYAIAHRNCDMVMVPASTALYRLCPAEYLAAFTFFLKQGSRLDEADLRRQLSLAGYQSVTQVVAPGEFSFRGGVIDLFPMGSAVPYRIDLDDDLIDSLRTFDVDTQRSIYKVNEIRLLPAREFPLDEAGRSGFRGRFREKFEGDPSKSRVYKDVSQGVAPAGIEYYLPLFFDHTATLFDYLPEGTVLALHHDVEAAARQFWDDAESRYRLLRGDPDRPLLPPGELFLTAEEFFVASKAHERVALPAPSDVSDTAPASGELVTAPLPNIAVQRRADDPLTPFKRFLDTYPGRILLCAESAGRRETMAEYLVEYGLQATPCPNYSAFIASGARLALVSSPLAAGFMLANENLALVTETELYADTVRRKEEKDEARRSSIEGMLRDLSELKVGDPVVHAQHGIGRYLGLVTLDLGEGATEFLHLEYADADKLYVPVAQLHLIGRYSGGPLEDAPLHRLGSGQWEKAKRKAAQQVRDSAAELLNLYAMRAAREGHSFNYSQHDMEAFAAGFGFEETPDQRSAISAVLEDMKSGKPMDRLICGDVGFGKTEVALRAAFAAISGGKQVAILTPTTLLAEQHFNTFSDRLADWPVKVAELSRFRSTKEISGALSGLASGTVDIAIGTHKLLSRDVKFLRLGLVIVDEEHRFGVRQKEALKALRAEVDVLTLTATPIPRTLAMSLEGLRDFSVIATAPQKRLAIKTFVTRVNDGIVREAVLRELKRGGQIYFLHNEVDTIAAMRDRLSNLVPEARIAVAHGQMRERDLEHVMRDFYQQRFNLLLCTTIIETGIDVPTANTILINRADRFGLAQLHQLRGRVGRSHHQAYAYLLVHEEVALTTLAKKRLEAIQMMEDLGSGFYLAMHDLEIRGAGEVLGESQSGEMQEIGFNLYNDMLNHAVRALKQGREPDLSEPLGVTTEINLHMPALFPDTYCGDVQQRLSLYKRFANCDTPEALDAMHEEIIDRFGLLPEPAQTLLESHRLRIASRSLGISRIDATAEQVRLQFVKHPPIDGAKLVALIGRLRYYKLQGPDKLKVDMNSASLAERVLAIRGILKTLTQAL